jgi:Zn-dependent M28 family amino/carboxypeptidase
MPRALSTAFATLALTACTSIQPPPLAIAPAAAPAPTPVPEVSMTRMSDVTRTLASDDFMGRAPGTEGERKSVAYLIDQFRAAGLEPGGSNGGWTQDVPMIRTQLQATKVSLSGAGGSRALQVPDDLYLTTQRAVDRADIAAAPMVFVGYGVAAPERNWDDFKGVDLKGKIAVFLVNDPDFEAAQSDAAFGKFGGKTMTYYGRWTYKFDEAARRGAIGAIVIHETEAAGYGWNVAGGGGGENYNIALGPDAQQPVLLQGWIQRPVATALFAKAGLDFEKAKRDARSPAFRPIDLETRMTVTSGVKLDRINSQNVIGKVTGAGHPNETVSYGGHWDAYGVGAPDKDGQTIRHGAADDALGLAAMLEIARQFTARPRPDRTVLFFAWTAEERGLLGSEYYSSHPLYPAETMAANLTLDTLQWAGPVRDALLIGQGQSLDMEKRLADAAAAQGRTVTLEGHPERGLFYRADHFSFAKRGVPVLLDMALAGAYDLADGGRPAGEAWLNAYTSSCYHQPCDAWAPTWNLGGARQEAELLYAIGSDLANSRAWPQWSDASEFRAVRERTAAARR